MNTRLNHLIQVFKRDLGLFLSISFGIFLFILFFQPFPLGEFDFNNRLLFVAGLAGIVFFLMVTIRLIIPIWHNEPEVEHEKMEWPLYLTGFLIWSLTSVAYAFYLRYVGGVEISFHLMFKAVLICLAPAVILHIKDMIFELHRKNNALAGEISHLRQKIKLYSDDHLTSTISFASESGSELLELVLAEVVFIRSADNYIEVAYREGDAFKKHLLRNTLKNIEFQLKPHPFFVRIHRTCIVNMHYAHRLERKNTSYWLALKEHEEKLPISRQYLLRVRELI